MPKGVIAADESTVKTKPSEPKGADNDSATPGRTSRSSYPTTINYNGWMDADDYRIRHQLMYEAELELLKEEKTENRLTFYTMFDEVVAGVEEGYTVKLRLHMETPPALSVSNKDGDFVGMFYLRDPEVQSSPTSTKRSDEDGNKHS